MWIKLNMGAPVHLPELFPEAPGHHTQHLLPLLQNYMLNLACEPTAGEVAQSTDRCYREHIAMRGANVARGSNSGTCRDQLC